MTRLAVKPTAFDKALANDDETPLSAKIEYVLTEVRVVLPGVQALLGFQLVIVLTRAFEDLPFNDNEPRSGRCEPWQAHSLHAPALVPEVSRRSRHRR
jgi:hypothetical protein